MKCRRAFYIKRFVLHEPPTSGDGLWRVAAINSNVQWNCFHRAILRANFPAMSKPSVRIELRFRPFQHGVSLVLITLGLTACPLPVPAQGTTPAVRVQQEQAAPSQPAATSRPAPGPHVPTEADILRGRYGPYRANNDLLYYHLDVRVDPEKKFISGKVTTRFKMLQDGTRIQLDLQQPMQVDKILFGTTELKYERKFGAVFVDFPETLRAGRIYSIDFYYSGYPVQTGRFGGLAFRSDPAGRPWINTACEGIGASIWWPDKDQWRDEVENMEISVAIPNDLVDVSNGKFIGKTDLGDGYTRWDWVVHYPINNYDVSLNIGKYEHFSDQFGDLPLDFYALPEDLDKAKKQFAQAKGMLQAFQHYFGEYPFKKDGYKLIEVPYSGMEHQSAVTYGNHFANGYLERDWTGVGISPRFDFIIIHESGHEWFGNSITAQDPSDMWIHEGWTTYLECLYVEYLYGHDDYLKYVNAYKSKVKNQFPIIAERGVNAEPPQDMYFKGALFLNTLRSVINDDKRWFKLIHDLYQHFKYQNIMTEDIVAFFNQKTGKDWTPIFNQYLRHTALPTLELKFDDAAGIVQYRWKVDEANLAMPVRVGSKENWQIINATTDWQTMKTSLKKDDFAVATDLYFINVEKE
jgi:aminopeptidase N